MLGQIEEYIYRERLSWVKILKDQDWERERKREMEGGWEDEWEESCIAVEVIMGKMDKEVWNVDLFPTLHPRQILCCEYQIYLFYYYF